MPVEDLVFSVGGGFLFGAVIGYVIKRVLKIAAVVIGLFVATIAYLSYRGWIDVKWAAVEDASVQAVLALNNTTTRFASHPSTIAASGFPTAAMFGFIQGLMLGFKKG